MFGYKNLLRAFMLKALTVLLIFFAASCGTSSSLHKNDPLDGGQEKIAGIRHLEDHMKDAANLSLIAGVYWSARDMDSSPVGNHHFITIVWQSVEQARTFSEQYGVVCVSFTNQAGLAVPYTTIGAFTDTGDTSGRIVLQFNEGSDVQAVKEQINPELYISWNTPDYDYEAHLVPHGLSSLGFTSLDAFMAAVVSGAKRFNLHYDAGTSVPYSLIDENCACMVNSQFNALGIPEKNRIALGEFFGVDWGEEDLISEKYFDEDYLH